MISMFRLNKLSASGCVFEPCSFKRMPRRTASDAKRRSKCFARFIANGSRRNDVFRCRSKLLANTSRPKPSFSLAHFFFNTSSFALAFKSDLFFGAGRLRIILGFFQLWPGQANSAVLEKGAVGPCAIDRCSAANTHKIAMSAAKR